MRKILYITLILLFGFFFFATFDNYIDIARADDFQEIEKKLDDKQKLIEEKAKKNDISNSDQFNELLDKFNSTKKNKNKDLDLNEFKVNLKNGLFTLSLNSRKLMIPLYILVIIINIFLIATLGSKSLKKRKKYIIGSIILTISLIIFLNIPLIMLYFQYNLFSDIFTYENIIKNIYKFIFFLKRNSITLAVLLIMYGRINKILGENDIPRKMFGSYLVKSGIVLFVVLQILPTVVAFII